MDCKKVFKCIIIGGGASGLVLAIELSKKFGGENIALVERLDRVGKKLLVSGNGQCNFSNKNLSFDNYHSNKKGFCNFALKKFDDNYINEYFKNLGVLTVVEDGKYYPSSKQASSVLDALRFKIESLGVKVFLNSKVVKISKSKPFEVLLENGGVLYGENTVLACGGKSAKHLGTDGTGYKLFEDFGHKTTELTPSLVQLKTEKDKIKGLKGLKQKGLLKVYNDGKFVKDFLGDIMFTDYGVSGNAVFSASSYIDYNNSKIVVDFCYQLSREELYSFLKEKVENCNYLTNEYLLGGIVNTKIASAVLRNSRSCDLSKKVEDKNLLKIVDAIKNYEIKVIGNAGFDNSQATKGGLDCNDFNQNLESKLQKGLYAVGEVLDVVGDCGGYNLQWAFSSALLVSEVIL